MNTGPFVSVILPAYNAERFIHEALDSILKQSYRRLEVIVADDGSRDGTAAGVRSYGNRVKYLYGENSGGASRPRNEGVKAASGDLIVFMDSDDLMLPDRIEREVDFLQRHPDVGLVFSDYQEFGDGREPSHFSTCPLLSRRLATLPESTTGLILLPDDSTELLLTENFGSSSPMVRRAVVDAVGGYDEQAIPSEDFDFQFRVASAFAIGLIPRVGWHKREHAANLSSNTPRVLLRKIAVRQDILERETIPRRRRKLQQMLAMCHFDLAYYYTGRTNALAVRHALSSVKFRPRLNLRLFLRILLDVLGRDTNSLRRVGGNASIRQA